MSKLWTPNVYDSLRGQFVCGGGGGARCAIHTYKRALVYIQGAAVGSNELPCRFVVDYALEIHGNKNKYINNILRFENYIT